MGRITSVTTVVDSDATTTADRPLTSWPGFIHVAVIGPDYSGALDLYIADDHARALVEQIAAALATPAPVGVTA